MKPGSNGIRAAVLAGLVLFFLIFLRLTVMSDIPVVSGLVPLGPIRPQPNRLPEQPR